MTIFDTLKNSLSSLFKPKTQTPVYPTPTGAPIQNMSVAPKSPAPNMSTVNGPVYAPPTPVKPATQTPQYNSQNMPLLEANVGPSTFASIPKTSTPTPTPVVPKTTTPSTPTFPVTPPTPTYTPPTQTSDGKNINLATGGVSNTPVVPKVDPYQETVSTAEKAYQESLRKTPEEIAAEEELSKLNDSFRQGYQNTEDQVIPMSFITGQQQSLEKRALNLAEPLKDKLARLEAKRLANTEASKFALERADKTYEKEKAKTDPKTVSKGESIIKLNPKTGQYETVFGSAKDTPTTYTEGADPTVDAYASAVLNGTAKLENIPEEYRGYVAQAIQGKSIKPETSEYNTERARRTMASVDELLPQISATTVGPIGLASSFVPGTAAFYLKAQLDTLKSNIAFGELTAMREASKTGGALGQVSDTEGRLLQSALGALNQGLTPDQFKTQLTKIKDSIERWQNAVNENGGLPTTGEGVVQTSIGPINTNW